ncbi:hypothetical protein ACFSYG_11885 [Leeuwenhoekiella polynyae]|uniref:Uncharacterized protein n=1 Tax=Leeuwenhoekiella polynyae TaxID=1550906 RepID=A0A4Q0PFN8_9FLAO|nr:hypothetical protein [Leeuwenhoekiella polynyae]RXG25704.1 hypothetical protein DSM02_871 [Leeuwenhoekiella polynyae]
MPGPNNRPIAGNSTTVVNETTIQNILNQEIFNNTGYTSITDIIQNLEANGGEIIELGDIGFTEDTTVYDFINASGDTWQLEENTMYFFTAQSGDYSHLYYWQGDTPLTIGAGGTPVTVDDFEILLISDNSKPEIPDNSLPKGLAGQAYYIKQGNEVEPDYTLKRGIVTETEAEFTEATTQEISLAEVFNQWQFFSHSGSKNAALASPPNYPGLDPGGFGGTPLTQDIIDQKKAWGYDPVNDRIFLTQNFGVYSGFVSPKSYTNYILEASLSSTSSDDDYLGLVMAFQKDPVTGYEYTISVIRVLNELSGQGNITYALYYNFFQNGNQSQTHGLSQQISIIDGTDLAPIIEGQGNGWVGNHCKLRVERVGDVFSVKTSQFGSYDLDDATLLTIDLNDTPELERFKTGGQVGFSALSQANAFFSDVYFTGFNEYILDLRNGYDAPRIFSFDFENNLWAEDPNLTYNDIWGINRFVDDYLFGRVYYLGADKPIKLPGGSGAVVAGPSEIIEVRSKDQIINQDLDETKVYRLMKSIEINGTTERIRIDNLKKLAGLGHNDTTISVTGNNGIGFVSSGNGRNIDLENLQIAATGTGAKAFDVTDVDGTHEMRLLSVNFSGCKSLGDLRGYRQYYWNDIGLYGCQDGATFHGTSNGAYINGLNLFSFAATGTLFKEGDNLEFTNRFFSALNLDVPTGAKLLDFAPDVFQGNELMQFNGCIAKVNGVLDPENSKTLVPNISANDTVSKWTGNTGLHNSSIERFIEDTGVAGNFEISWLVDTYYLEMTADTTFTERDLPAPGKNTKEILIYLTGDFAPTFPAGWTVNQVGTYKGADVNEIRIKNIKTGIYFTQISNSLSIYPAPFIESIEPSGVTPNTTQDFIVKGSFFTPEGFGGIVGQTRTSSNFKNQGEYRFTADIGANEGDFDLFMNNGTETKKINAVSVVLGDVFQPLDVTDWTVLTGDFEFAQGKASVVDQLNVYKEANWNQVIDFTKNFRIDLAFTDSDNPHSLGQKDYIYMVRTSDDVRQFGFEMDYNSGYGLLRHTPNNSAITTGISDFRSYWLNDGTRRYILRIEWIDDIMTVKKVRENGTQDGPTGTITPPYGFDENMYIQVSLKYGAALLKYVEFTN